MKRVVVVLALSVLTAGSADSLVSHRRDTSIRTALVYLAATLGEEGEFGTDANEGAFSCRHAFATASFIQARRCHWRATSRLSASRAHSREAASCKRARATCAPSGVDRSRSARVTRARRVSGAPVAGSSAGATVGTI